MKRQKKQCVFVYGTLKVADLRRLILDRDIPAVSAVLYDYTLKERDGFYFVSSEEGEQVKGSVICLTEAELEICDKWEEVPLYERIRVSVIINGKKYMVWVYVRNNTEGIPVTSNKGSGIDINDVIRQISDFKKELNTSS